MRSPFFYDLALARDAECRIETPTGHNVFVYVYDGRVGIGDRLINRGEIGLLSRGDSVSIRTDDSARCIVVGGRPLEEPVARYGPFVMKTEQELRQAFIDFQSGRF